MITNVHTDGLHFVGISQRAVKYLLEMPQSPTTLQMDYRPSAFNKEVHWKCHNHSPTTL
jgi:hypothetical protein